MITNVDLSFRAEALHDRRFAACAIIHPHVALRMNERPHVDLAARAFFAWLDRHQEEILSMSEDEAIMRIAGYPLKHKGGDSGWKERSRGFFRFLDDVNGRSTLLILLTIEAELQKVRATRKLANWYDDFLTEEMENLFSEEEMDELFSEEETGDDTTTQ